MRIQGTISSDLPPLHHLTGYGTPQVKTVWRRVELTEQALTGAAPAWLPGQAPQPTPFWHN